jgi:hypothetical protein
MALDVSTNDAAALTDSDLDELASMEDAFSAGQLSKAKEDWVLITTARFGGALHGFTFSTLERIGGTPCVLIGLMSVKRSSKRDQVLRGLIGEAYHRALMAFPDEDVVVGCRFVNADGLEAFKDLREVTPRPARTPWARSGPGAAAWPSGSASTPSTTPIRSSPPRAVPTATSTTNRRSPRSSTPRSSRCSKPCRFEGRCHGGLRLDDGRRPPQAREALTPAPTAMR